MTYSNISYFNAPSSVSETTYIYRDWAGVSDFRVNDWAHWSGGTWKDLAVLSEFKLRTTETSRDAYNAAIGLKVESVLGSSPMTLGQGRGRSIDGVNWQSTKVIPT